MNYDVFITYPRGIEPIASTVCRMLEKYGMKCWLALRNLPSDEKYEDIVDGVIRDSRLVVAVCLDPESVLRECRMELLLALKTAKIIVPCRAEDASENNEEFCCRIESLVGQLVRRERVATDPVSVESTDHPGIYKEGDYYNMDGTEGVVFEVDSSGMHGKIMAMRDLPEELAWCLDDELGKVGAEWDDDGMRNMEMIQQQPEWQQRYPAFAGCAALGEGWYLPSRKEFANLFEVQRLLPKQQQTEIGFNHCHIVDAYWTSSEHDSKDAFCSFSGSNRIFESKSKLFWVRPVAKF